MSDDNTPVVLGARYRLVERLGSGGMADVWCAYDEVLHRRVAVKMVSPAMAEQEHFLRLLRLEARAAARLSHPNITGVYDYGEEDSAAGRQPYLVMELVEGRTLATVLAGAPDGLDWPVAVRIVRQVSAGLAAAHARGIVHRDISPANVMLSADRVRILDFGISAVAGAADDDDELMGTPDYVSPERIAGNDATPAADVYALGVLLFRCLTGGLPWGPATATQRLRDHLFRPPMELPPIDGLPSEIADLCLRCLAKDPQDRPTSAEIAAELGEESEPIPASSEVDDDGQTRLLTIPTGVLGGTRRSTRDLPTERAEVPLLRRPAVAALVLAGACLMVAGVGGWRLAARPAATAGTVDGCLVTYALRSDVGRRFEATVTIQASSPRAASAWALTFVLPGDQEVTGRHPAEVIQQERQVTVTAATALDGSRPVTVDLSGGYRAANAPPTGFALDGRPCASVVDGRPVAATPAAKKSDDDSGEDGRGKGKGKGKGDDD